MSQISSINFKKSTSFQVFHNSTIRPNYAIGGDLECTLKGYAAKALKEQIIQRAKENYAKHCKAKNKAFQATNYEWSAVVNLKADSTMQDLEKLATHFKEKYGFQCYQIAIHRDEGYEDEQGNKHINHHAHLEFITLDEKTGKQCFKMRDFPPQKMRQIQTEVAEILKMERGIDKRLSGAKRIEPRIYAKMKEDSKQELRIEKTKNKNLQAELDKEKIKNQKLEAELLLSQKQINERIEQERKAWIAESGHTKEDYAELRELKKQNYAKIEDLEKKIQALKEEIKNKDKEILEKQTELALELKNKDEVIQNLENQNKTLRIENKALKRKNAMFDRALECIYKTPNAFQFAYKQVIKRLINYLNEPTAQNLKRTSIRELQKEFDETSDIIENNVKVIRSSDLKEQRKQELIAEARYNGITLERKKEIELELERTRGISR